MIIPGGVADLRVQRALRRRMSRSPTSRTGLGSADAVAFSNAARPALDLVLAEQFEGRYRSVAQPLEMRGGGRCDLELDLLESDRLEARAIAMLLTTGSISPPSSRSPAERTERQLVRDRERAASAPGVQYLRSN
jgi:hypothetical protein